MLLIALIALAWIATVAVALGACRSAARGDRALLAGSAARPARTRARPPALRIA